MERKIVIIPKEVLSIQEEAINLVELSNVPKLEKNEKMCPYWTLGEFKETENPSQNLFETLQNLKIIGGTQEC